MDVFIDGFEFRFDIQELILTGINIQLICPTLNSFKLILKCFSVPRLLLNTSQGILSYTSFQVFPTNCALFICMTVTLKATCHLPTQVTLFTILTMLGHSYGPFISTTNCELLSEHRINSHQYSLVDGWPAGS